MSISSMLMDARRDAFEQGQQEGKQEGIQGTLQKMVVGFLENSMQDSEILTFLRNIYNLSAVEAQEYLDNAKTIK